MLIYYSHYLRNVVFMIITNSADINVYFFIHVIHVMIITKSIFKIFISFLIIN